MEGLQFGYPDTIEQALIRLPTRKQGLCSGEDSVIEHLAHFREWFEEIYQNILDGSWPDIEQRFVSMTVEDIVQLRRTSFRPGKTLSIKNWAYVPDALPNWGCLFPVGSLNKRWWKIDSMIPQPNTSPDIGFVQIEQNSQFFPNRGYRSNFFSEIDIGFANIFELELLIKSLT